MSEIASANPPTPFLELHDHLEKLISARDDLAHALHEESTELASLASARAELTKQFRVEYLEGHNCSASAAEIRDFSAGTAEQKRIDAIVRERKNAEGQIRRLRLDLMPLLDGLRSVETGEAFQALDGLLLDPGLDTTNRFIALVKNVVRTSGHRPRRRSPAATDDNLEAVKVVIQQSHKDGFSHEEICATLGRRARPPRAQWRHLAWPEAFRHKEYHDSVNSWISKVIHKQLPE